MIHDTLEPHGESGPVAATTLRQSSSVSGSRVVQSSVYRPMSVGRATTPVAWISRRRRFRLRRQLFSAGRITGRLEINGLREAGRRLAPPRLVFVLDLVSRLMDRGRAPVRLPFRSSSPSSSSSFLSLPFRDFLLSRWSPRRGEGPTTEFLRSADCADLNPRIFPFASLSSLFFPFFCKFCSILFAD